MDNSQLTLRCETCGTQFLRYRSVHRHSAAHGSTHVYCSQACTPRPGQRRGWTQTGANAAKAKAPQRRKRSGVFFACTTCGETFYVPPCRIRQSARTGATIRFCSAKCYDKRGFANPNWRGPTPRELGRRAQVVRARIGNPWGFKTGRHNVNYRGRFFDQSHPLFLVGRSVTWWRHYLKHTIAKCERCGYDRVEILVVHHRDRDRKNNVRANLELLCPNCHEWEHYEQTDGKAGAAWIQHHGRTPRTTPVAIKASAVGRMPAK